MICLCVSVEDFGKVGLEEEWKCVGVMGLIVKDKGV